MFFSKTPETVEQKKIVFKNWTLLEAQTVKVNTSKLAFIKCLCKCGNEHFRSIEAIINTSGYCVSCGTEDTQYIPIKNHYDEFKAGDMYGHLLIMRKEPFISANGKTSQGWVAKCSLCSLEQRINKYFVRKRCTGCLGAMGQTYNQLTLIAPIPKELNSRAISSGRFRCSCGNVDIFKISRVIWGYVKACKQCKKKLSSEIMREVSIKKHQKIREMNERMKMLEQELAQYKSKSE